jgi:hypothetical protein
MISPMAMLIYGFIIIIIWFTDSCRNACEPSMKPTPWPTWNEGAASRHSPTYSVSGIGN